VFARFLSRPRREPAVESTPTSGRKKAAHAAAAAAPTTTKRRARLASRETRRRANYPPWQIKRSPGKRGDRPFTTLWLGAVKRD